MDEGGWWRWHCLQQERGVFGFAFWVSLLFSYFFRQNTQTSTKGWRSAVLVSYIPSAHVASVVLGAERIDAWFSVVCTISLRVALSFHAVPRHVRLEEGQKEGHHKVMTSRISIRRNSAQPPRVIFISISCFIVQAKNKKTGITE